MTESTYNVSGASRLALLSDPRGKQRKAQNQNNPLQGLRSRDDGGKIAQASAFGDYGLLTKFRNNLTRTRIPGRRCSGSFAAEPEKDAGR